MCLYANNLYGWAMSQPLPTGRFQWKDPNEVQLSSYVEDSDKGLLLEVDLEYPKELHDLHNDHPLAPGKKTIKKYKLSKYYKMIEKKYEISVGLVTKLTTTSNNKEKVHYTLQKFAIAFVLRNEIEKHPQGIRI